VTALHKEPEAPVAHLISGSNEGISQFLLVNSKNLSDLIQRHPRLHPSEYSHEENAFGARDLPTVS
jgi:hypothetical protein